MDSMKLCCATRQSYKSFLASSNWIVFFLASWMAWSAFLGIFIASISKGRKLWEVVLYTMFAPAGFCLVSFCILGGAGLRQARQALELEALGVRFFNNSGHFASPAHALCYDVPQQDVVVGVELVFTNYLLGVTPVCKFDESDAESSSYKLLNSFRFPDTFRGDGMGSALSVLLMLTTALYGVTSCDSAVLIVDNLASSGRRNNHWARRVFWSLTMGALATAVMSGGHKNQIALQALQAAQVLCGFPFGLVLCFMMQSIHLLCRAAENPERAPTYPVPSQPEFDMPIYGGVFNAVEYIASLGRVNQARVDLRMDKPSRRHVVEFGKGLVAPFVSLHQILASTYPETPVSNGAAVASYTICYLGWIALLGASSTYPEFRGLRWTLFVVNGGTLCLIRAGFRAKYNLRSNGLADVIASAFLWPQVLTQMRIQQECTPCQSRVDPSPLKDEADAINRR
jgi:BCCT, betaine/carnitine/choline family transporter